MNWKVIIPWVLAIGCAIFIIVTVFGPSRNQDTKYLDLLLAEKDKQIESIKADAKKWEDHYNSDIAESKRVDSILVEKLKVNRIKYVKVPDVVNSYSDDELRSAVAEYNATH